jgi:hypothetical protein
MRVQSQKNGKPRVNLHGTILKGKSIGSGKKKLKRRAHDLKNQGAS